MGEREKGRRAWSGKCRGEGMCKEHGGGSGGLREKGKERMEERVQG